MSLASLVAVFGYSFMLLSLWQFRKNNANLALLLLVLCALLLRVSCALDPVLHTWDERFHALVAKNLLADPTTPKLFLHAFNPEWHLDWPNWVIWLHKPPVPLYTMAISLKCFGITPFALRIPSIVLSSLSVLLGYRVTNHFYAKTVAYWSAFFLAIHGFLIELSTGRAATDHIDIFFLFFILLSIHFFILHSTTAARKYLLYAGLSAGLAVLSKWLPALVIFPVAWFVYQHEKVAIPQRVLYLGVGFAICLCTFLPWELYQHFNFPEAYWNEVMHRIGHFDESLDGRGKPWWYHLDQLRIRFGELVYLPVLYFVWIGYKNRSAKELLFLTWFGIVYVVFSATRTKLSGHVMIACLPIFVMCGFLISTLSSLKLVGWKRILNDLTIILLVALPIRYSIERVKPFTEPEQPTIYDSKYQTGSGFVFGIEDAVRFSFHNQWEAYRYVPEERILDSLTVKGILYDLSPGAKASQP